MCQERADIKASKGADIGWERAGIGWERADMGQKLKLAL